METMLRVVAAVAFSVLSHFRAAWTGLAVVPFPGSLSVGGAPASVGSPATVFSHDGVMTAVALTIEIALFVLVPIYLRARRRAQIRSTIRVLHDSRLNPAAAPTIQVAPAAVRKGGTKQMHLRLIGGWGEHRALRQS